MDEFGVDGYLQGRPKVFHRVFAFTGCHKDVEAVRSGAKVLSNLIESKSDVFSYGVKKGFDGESGRALVVASTGVVDILPDAINDAGFWSAARHFRFIVPSRTQGRLRARRSGGEYLLEP